MSGKFISREAIKNALVDKFKARIGASRIPTWNDAFDAVTNLPPAADVVEVVRCGECIRKDICRTSNVWAVSPDDNWFCADGERKDGGQDETTAEPYDLLYEEGGANTT